MSNDDIQPLTVTVEQAAKLLGIGRSTAYELVHTGDIPSLRLCRRILVPAAQLLSMINGSAEASVTPAGAELRPSPHRHNAGSSRVAGTAEEQQSGLRALSDTCR